MEASFDQVGVFPAFDMAKSKDGVGNLAIMAYQGGPRPLRVDRHKFQAHPSVSSTVFDNLGKQFQFSLGTPAIVLTDDYNPIVFFDSWLRETVRKSILDTTDWDILIS